MAGGGGGGQVVNQTGIPVLSGATYSITVGAGGQGCTNFPCTGQAGSDSKLELTSSTLATAVGGKGGISASGNGGYSGSGKAGGSAGISSGGGGGGDGTAGK